MAVRVAVTNKDHQEISVEARQIAAWEWRCRHDFELAARSRFSRLADTLKAHHAAAQIVALAETAAKDEHRHAAQCRELVAELGAKPPSDRTIVGQAVAPDAMSARSRLLYEVVAMSCVTETLSCTILGILIERTTHPKLKRTMQSILSDAVNHSRLGWAYLADVASRGPTGFLSDYLPAMLAGTVSEELFEEGETRAESVELDGLGVLNRAERFDIFQSTMVNVVFPGLERYEVDTHFGRAWLGRHGTT